LERAVLPVIVNLSVNRAMHQRPNAILGRVTRDSTFGKAGREWEEVIAHPSG
jgi:hypothetical protein